jgi:Cu/Ag efflux protein CusF
MGTIASAVDYDGKITAFDADARKITIHVDDKDQSYVLAKDCKIYKLRGGGNRGGGYKEDPKGLKDVVAGAKVSISTDFVDGDEVVTLLKIK